MDFRVGNTSTFDVVGGIAQLPLNTYTHVAATYNGTIMTIYINGVLDASKTTSIGALADEAEDLRIGSSGFKGAIDELGIYSRALSQGEVQAIVAAGAAGKCKPAGPTPAPTPTACVTPPPQMLAWYPGDGNGIDLRDGNSAERSSGPASVTFTPGKVGQAFQFNGTGRLNVEDSGAPQPTNALTVDVWLNGADANQFGMVVFKGNAGSNGNQPYSIFYENSGGFRRVHFRVGNATAFDALASFSNLPLDTYTHVAATYDGTRMRIYLNGVLDAEKTTNIGPLANTTLPLLIGHQFAGKIDEVEIFNRVLTVSEIQLLHAAGSFGKCKPANNPPPPQTACVEPPPQMVA